MKLQKASIGDSTVIMACLLVLVSWCACGGQEVWERLTEYEKPKNAAEQKAWDLIKECRHQGAEGAKRLIAEMSRMPQKYRKNALGALSRIQSQEARDYLVKLALSSSDSYAAIVYLENSGDPLATRNLLQSTNRVIQIIALEGLESADRNSFIRLDRRTWEVSKDVLASENLEHRSLVARVIANSRGTEVTAEEKALALLQAFVGIETLPEAQKPAGYGVHTFLKGARYELACLSLVGALAEIRGLEEAFLRQQAAETTGLVRDCVLLAQGRRGDGQAKEELQRLAREHRLAVFRWEALGAFFKLGTTEDLPWLQQVAEQDPFYIAKWLPGKVRSPEDEVPRDYYSVRERAREVSRAIRQQAGRLPEPSSAK